MVNCEPWDIEFGVSGASEPNWSSCREFDGLVGVADAVFVDSPNKDSSLSYPMVTTFRVWVGTDGRCRSSGLNRKG